MAYFTSSQGYLFLCLNISLEETIFLRFYKKIGIAFIVNEKSNSAENVCKKVCGERQQAVILYDEVSTTLFLFELLLILITKRELVLLYS